MCGFEQNRLTRFGGWFGKPARRRATDIPRRSSFRKLPPTKTATAAGVSLFLVALGPRPNRNEMIPLFEMLPNDGFKRTHDLLCQLLASIALAQGGAVVGNGGQDLGCVTFVQPCEVNRQDDAARCAG